ncbi:MAG TPA: type II toxin-antitoxin system VapC family toxin [Patescibacteria group bacterium]|jgi:PIN domain nuclease of toxin-antitoxin system|nr:type II toxin-antitoxin system VapC family toxin [Patescibacteria group bacterium]
MIILLDTNVLVWLLEGGAMLSKQAKSQLESAEAVYASAINIVELRIKSMLSKISIPETLFEDIKAAGLEVLPFTADHAEALGKFPELSRHDPFDRMLLAQASVDDMYFLTSDQVLIDLGQNFVLSARS